MKKMWGGRFNKKSDKLLEEFNGSIDFDYKLYEVDIKGSIAHAKMLAKIGVLSKTEEKQIIEGLKEILSEIESGNFEFKLELEDIHMNIEKVLTDKLGTLGKKLHTGRSRNDQVAVDLRMYSKDKTLEIMEALMDLLSVVIKNANDKKDVILPGYTHLQGAQPVRLGFHYMSYFEMFKRDFERFKDSYKRTDILPLGSGALAGVNYDNDRFFLADQLRFKNISLNAMDSVSDRDFVIEIINCCSITMMHLSRWCEELIIWTSNNYGFIEMDDSFSTGSSIMPQKKNPDAAELIRGKTGRVFGDLMSILTVMKGLPLAYNKDMQEDKECLFDAIETTIASLNVFTKMFDTITVNSEKMIEATKKGFLNATDLADYLVGKGIEFRNCHEIVGKIVSDAVSKNKTLEEYSLEEFKEFSNKIDEDVYESIDIEKCVENKISFGSTSIESLLYAIETNEIWLEREENVLEIEKQI